jgi:hypothetical protein
VLQQALLRATGAHWTAATELLLTLLLPEPVSKLRYAECDSVAVELSMWGRVSSSSGMYDGDNSSSSDAFAWRRGIAATADDVVTQARDRSSSASDESVAASSSTRMDVAAASTPLQQGTQQTAAVAAVDTIGEAVVKQEDAHAGAAAASSDNSSDAMSCTDSLDDGAAVLCLTMYDTVAAAASAGELTYAHYNPNISSLLRSMGCTLPYMAHVHGLPLVAAMQSCSLA